MDQKNCHRSDLFPDATSQDTTSEGRQPLDVVFSVAYEELRRLARAVLRDDRNATITPTTLVNETWLKLAGSPQVAETSHLHFKRIAARAMRQILVEAARRRRAQIRGGGSPMVTFDEALALPLSPVPKDILQLDQALDELAKISPRQALLVECRFFGGLDVEECVALLGVSETTVMRDWRSARAWLALNIRRQAEA
jgi:RNA polymerase sigma factor (TIGR02999 family)